MATIKHAHFSEVVDTYRALFFDAYGVLNDSQNMLPGVEATLTYLSNQNIPFWIVSNDASQSPAAMTRRYLNAQGQPLVPSDNIVSAGLMAQLYAHSRPEWQRVAYLGPRSSAELLAAPGRHVLTFSELPLDDRVDALVLMDDVGFDWERDLNRLVNYLRSFPDLPLLSPNPDLLYHAGPNEVGIATGALAHLLETITGKTFTRFGKPNSRIFQHAFDLARQVVPTLKPSQVLMVGDNLLTDIPGAKVMGFDAALVLSGNTSPQFMDEMLATATHQPDFILPNIQLHP